jgi:hypothetical protein
MRSEDEDVVATPALAAEQHQSTRFAGDRFSHALTVRPPVAINNRFFDRL